MAQGRVGGCIARYPAAFVARDQQQQGLPPIGQFDPVPSSLELLSRVATSLTKAPLLLFSTSAGDVPIGWVCSGRLQRLARASAASRIRTSGTKPAPTSRGRSVDMGADTALRLDYSRLCSAGAVTSFLTTARSNRKMRSPDSRSPEVVQRNFQPRFGP